ncbi:hypothetical protein ACFY04_34560 [Streptomyces sp. NPDC001549]|uniref:hypothetical protein n=1 Tax=Streptomyces sp. NPDC001549 TaxID=3364586 RepID=UPI003682766A
MSDAQIGDLVEDGPGGGRWIYTDRRGGTPILRPVFGGTGNTREADHPNGLRVIKTRKELHAESPGFM